jgi:uncharacterized protein (DUF305 family)
MTTPVHHVNTSDATYMQEMIVLLRKAVQDGVWAAQMASHQSGDPRLRSLAQESSASAARQVTAMISCLDDWNAETRPGSHQRAQIEAPTEARPPATAGTTGYDDELADLQGSRFDARVSRNLLAHHRAIIARSRLEMIEGLNAQSRDFARAAIIQHSGDLQRLEEGPQGAPGPMPRRATLARRGGAWAPAVRRGPLPARGASRRSAPPCGP